MRPTRDSGPVDPDVTPADVPVRGPVWTTLRDRWDILAVIAAGGMLGSLGRWSLSELVPHDADQIAAGTWIENITGALMLGALMVFVVDVWPPTRYVRPFLGVGVLGGYTTFSTYMLDTRTLLSEGEAWRAAVYLFGTLLSGLLALWAGVVVARTAVSLMARGRSRT